MTEQHINGVGRGLTDCACGHPRHFHADGTDVCNGLSMDYKLPPGTDPVPHESLYDETGWPTVWPPKAQCPLVEVPCRCKFFIESDPDLDGDE